jgi:hemerythrin-like domain-containing protein
VRKGPDLGPFLRQHAEGREQARRLHRAAGSGPEGRRRAGREFLAYFRERVVPHIRAEEAMLFPLVASGTCTSALLVEHEHLHVLARRLSEALDAGAPEPALLEQIVSLLDAHIGRQERELYPLVARQVDRGNPWALALVAALT